MSGVIPDLIAVAASALVIGLLLWVARLTSRTAQTHRAFADAVVQAEDALNDRLERLEAKVSQLDNGEQG